MRLVFKALLVVVLVLGIGNYLVYLKTGQMPLRDLRERWGSDWLVDMKEKYAPDQLAAQAKKGIDELTQDEAAEPVPTKVYKWTDAQGRVHYGDKPQSNGAQQIEVNTRGAMSPPENQTIVPAPGESTQNQVQTPIEKARAAAEQLNQRERDLEGH